MELIGQMFSLLLEGREREEESNLEGRGRAVQDNILARIAAEGASLQSFSTLASELAEAITCDGIAIRLGEETILNGLTPTREEFIGVCRFLNERQLSGAFSTQCLGNLYKPAKDFPERGAGLLAIPISRTAGDYIVFFRREVTHTITWAGNPEKPVETGPNGVRLTPRKSFDAWTETVRGESDSWKAIDLRIAESLRVSLMEVVLRLAYEAESDRKVSHQRQELLIAELNHRVRNILGLVKGLLAQTSTTGSAKDFADIVAGRVESLARAHEQITADDWRPASLKALINAEAEPYIVGRSDRLRLQGEEILIAPQAFTTMALVIHELMTNSAKYGALCDRSGWVTITWYHDSDKRLILEWIEEGGPPVRPPSRRGFGSTIIERSIPFDLKGEAKIDYELSGVKARFVIPAQFIEIGTSENMQVAQQTPAKDVVLLNLTGQMLVAEDNMIISMDAEDALHDLGIEQVTIVSNVEDGLRYLENFKPDAALLDFNLGNENTIPLAMRLQELGVPFFFATGYGDTLKLPDAFLGTPVVKKPYNVDSLRLALSASLNK